MNFSFVGRDRNIYPIWLIGIIFILHNPRIIRNIKLIWKPRLQRMIGFFGKIYPEKLPRFWCVFLVAAKQEQNGENQNSYFFQYIHLIKNVKNSELLVQAINSKRLFLGVIPVDFNFDLFDSPVVNRLNCKHELFVLGFFMQHRNFSF